MTQEHPTTPAWTSDPIERARFVDGEGTSEERLEREADLVRDSAARERVAREARFVEAIRRAAEGEGGTPLGAVPPSEFFEARLRRALAADRAAGFPPEAQVGGGRRAVRRRVAASLAAGVALVAGTILWSSAGPSPASAAGREVILAAETFREATRDGIRAGGEMGAGCGVADSQSPRGFPPVKDGELELASCGPADASGAPGSVSVLRRGGGDRVPRGLVVVPWDGQSTSTDVGYTRLGDVVVFDVSIGHAKYYLATRWDSVAGTPSCAACHGPARADNPRRNPHTFVDRTAGR